MSDFVHTLQIILAQDPFYGFFALSGSALFILQFFLTLFGHSSDLGDDHSYDFKWFTKQTLTGFFMFFGLVGLTCKQQFELSERVTAVWAVTGGLIALFVTAMIFKMAKILQSSGVKFNIQDAVGKEATVYQRIPKKGTGKISISLHHHTYEIEAVSMTEEEISSFTQVKIVKNMDDKTVVVVPIK